MAEENLEKRVRVLEELVNELLIRLGGSIHQFTDGKLAIFGLESIGFIRSLMLSNQSRIDSQQGVTKVLSDKVLELNNKFYKEENNDGTKQPE